ncbi:hypothetical protein CKP64_15835 [Salmonella enterica]|nr:hypothetical protein [Salmonella enterica]EEG7113598.1 hypothetical protein [Salmonella enterica]
MNRIFFNLTGVQQRRNTRCATLSDALSSICCVIPLPRDRPRTTGKGRCGYSATVVHFRKLRYKRKVGSGRNSEKVI